MTENRSWLDKLSNRIFGVPAVAQLWAKLTARRTGVLSETGGPIPFHHLSKPLSECSFALVTTGGIHLQSQPPFDMENPDGDATYREILRSVDTNQITITHKYYDHRDADRDLNVIFPIDQFRDLANRGVIGSLALRHFGFMGHIDGPLIEELTGKTAPEVADRLQVDGVDCVFLTPA
jgi:D-proline reductase (dithiol) PrdB